MQIDYPSDLREHADDIPARPDGRNRIVRIAIPTSTNGDRYYEIVQDDDLDGLVRIAPLSVADGRDPFWISGSQLVEVPGAYVDDDGYLRIPTCYTGPAV